MRNLSISIVLMLVPLISWGASTPEELLNNGFKAYSKNGSEAAFIAWIKGSAMEGTKQAEVQMSGISQIETYFGGFESYELIDKNNLSERSTVLRFVANYEKGPAYGWFQMYETSDGDWIMSYFRFHTTVTEVWPPYLVFGE